MSGTDIEVPSVLYSRQRHLTRFLLPLLLLFFGGCDFSDPDQGYDDSWSPDHSESDEGSPATLEDNADNRLEIPEDPSGAEVVTERRPADIIADTSSMKVMEGTWEEELEGKSAFRAYGRGGGTEPEMIVERSDHAVRTYFFNEGILFYYTEESHDGSHDLTVEFDDFGDVRGAQKLRDGRRVPATFDDYANIVERAIELKRSVK